jgi:hypothetical protein
MKETTRRNKRRWEDNINMNFREVGWGRRPPVWSSGQSSWLQIQSSGLDSWRYQVF